MTELTLPRRRGIRAALTTATLVAVTAAFVAVPVLPSAASPANPQQALAPAVDNPASLTDIVLGVGADETQRNVTWYSSLDVAQSVQFAPSDAVVGGVFPASATTVATSAGGPTSSGEFFRDATLAGLAENTAYSYRVGSDANGWSAISSFRTQTFTGDFSFLFFGDAQIGASGNTTRDQAGWQDTLNVAVASYPDSELLFSAGDQVETANNEAQYQALFAPEQVRSIPFVATNGNHDVGSKAYEQHFTLPNEDLTAGAAGNSGSSGGDYWFLYKDVLFVNINSNSRDYALHNAFMDKVIAEQGPKAKWKVLAFHHSIYSVAAHTNDGDILDRRSTMPSKISDLGFDMVLMGHDHSYTRSYLIKDGQVANGQELAGAHNVVAEEGEVLYVTANSASGSKYYDVAAPNAPFASVINQEKVRNYSVLEVTDKDITMRTLRSQQNGAQNPVNSIVDEVVLTRADHVAPVLLGTDTVEVPFGSTFDPKAGVSAADDVDGDITASITVTGAVDTSVLGAQTLGYSVKDAAGNETTASRTVTVVPADLTVGAIAISGTAKVGSTLKASAEGWTAGARFEYRWLADGQAVPGATASSLTLPASSVGKEIAVEVTAVLPGHNPETMVSEATAAVAKGTLKTGKVTVGGTPKVGAKLTASAGTWSPKASLSYQWLAGGKAVSGAKSKSFTIPASLAGAKLSVRVTGTLAGYQNASATSATGKAVASARFSTKPVKITGTVKVGKIVRVSTKAWNPKPSYSYRWYANGKAIKGATKSSLKLTNAVGGKKLTVKVTGKRTGYVTTTVTSPKRVVKR